MKIVLTLRPKCSHSFIDTTFNRVYLDTIGRGVHEYKKLQKI